MTVSEFELIKTLINNLYEKVKDLKNEMVDMSQQIQEVGNKVDSLGKVVQTQEGNGTMEDPFRGWKVGDSVEAGKWYLTDDGYLWEATKSGIPSSTTDREYFDVVGL